MRGSEGCGLIVLGALVLVVACLVFVALAGAIVLDGQVPLFEPRLTSFEPKPGYPFRPTTPITLTFDQQMNPASVEVAFSIEPGVYGNFYWNKDYTQVTFVPEESGYRPGTTYHVQMASGAEGGTIPRTTSRTVDWSFSLPPLLESQVPTLGEDDLGAWTGLEATFNYPLDCSHTLQTFSVIPEAVGVLECRGQTLAFNPSQPLAPDTAYVAEIEHVYLEGDHAARSGVRWEFGTAAPLTILDVSPDRRLPIIDLWTPIRITFNRPVVADSVTSRFSLNSPDGIPLAGQATWEQDGTVFVFQPEESWWPSTSYEFLLQEGVQDELGFELAEPLSGEFGTLQMLGLPLPVFGSTNVALDSTIRVPFTRPMDRPSVEAGLVFSPTMEGEVAWETDVGGEDILVFTPLGGLAPETFYQIALSPDVRDASGASLAQPHQWAFTTQPLLLRTSVPSEGIDLVDLQRAIRFKFALPMDRASVRAALTTSPAMSGDLIWSDDDHVVTFQPDPAWLPGTDYQVTLSGSARTADGYQALGQDRTLTFSTAAVEVQFGEGPNVQVLDAGGERTFQVIYRGANVAAFALYPITPTQFLDLYSSGFRGIGPKEAQLVAVTDLTPAVEWREVLTPVSDYDYDGWMVAEGHIPADAPSGMYVLASPQPVAGEEGQANGQLLVALTRHNLVLKRALAGSGSRTQAQVVAWDTELSEGAPVVSATVRLYDRDGTFLAEGFTGADGLLTLDVGGDPGPLMALSDQGGDMTVCGLGNEWSEGGWWWWWTQPSSRPLYITYSYTDRPIYRPSQIVHFKHFVRADDDVSYTLPSPDLPVTVRLRDARDNVAATQVLTPTQFGTVHGEFQLTDEPMLGTWNLETEVEGSVAHQPLKVEEYRKPEYEVTVRTPQKTYIAGEIISVTVDANYYFGQPVANAMLQLDVYRAYPEYDLDADEPRFGYVFYQVEGRTDAQGRWMEELSTDDVFHARHGERSALLALEATITDDSGQSVSSYQTILVHRTSRGVTLLLEKHGYRPGEEIVFDVGVRDWDGEPVAGTELTAQVFDWADETVAGITAETDARGQANFALKVDEQGWYQLRVSGTDDSGREIQAESYLWVYDPTGRAPWHRGGWGEKQPLTVGADQATYAVGDEAQIVIYAPAPGPALLTFERGKTRHAEPITLVSGTNLITVPIRSDFAPNIYVAVNQFGSLGDDWWYEQSRPEGQLHQASTQLLVPMNDRLLTVTLTAEQETYAPGDEATFHVQVTDHEGRPVTAEVSLAVVDEAIYALAEDMTKDPFEVFYAPRLNIVRTYDSLKPARWLFPEGPGLGGAGEDGATAPRRDFLDTAYWAPTVVTGEDGEATITFELPDNLTEWRALARAVTTDTLVGQTTTHVVVSQDIVVRPTLPRFLVQGDAITLTAVVHNFTDQPVSATLELALEGLMLADEREDGESNGQVVGVPAGGSAVAGWPIWAEQPGDALVTVQATATRGARLVGRDAVELPLPVHPLAVPEVATMAGELTPDQPTATVTFTLPSDAIEGLSRLEINLAPSVAPGLLQGLEYLIDYPFG